MEKCNCTTCRSKDDVLKNQVYQNMINNNQILIETQEWDYECGDGCCYDYGTNLYINNYHITDRFDWDTDILKEVLTLITRGIDVIVDVKEE